MPSEETNPNPDEAVLAAFVKALEAEGPEKIDLNRWSQRHPALADDFRGIRQAIQNLEQSCPVDEPPIPKRLGEFRILRKLARGGMGEVYLAEQPALKRLVAIKTIRHGRVSPINRSRPKPWRPLHSPYGQTLPTHSTSVPQASWTSVNSIWRAQTFPDSISEPSHI